MRRRRPSSRALASPRSGLAAPDTPLAPDRVAGVASWSAPRPVRVSLFGLGYVGAVTAACLARAGHQVIGVDSNRDKVEQIRRGASPIIEDAVGRLVSEAVAAGRLSAGVSCRDAIRRSDVSLICVGTPSRANGGQDLSHVERVVREIGSALRSKRSWHLVVLRSTVLPGTCRSVVLPILERASGRRAGSGFGFCFNPEFLREGSSVRDFHAPPHTVLGELDPRSGDALVPLYGGIRAPLFRTGLEEAEMVKYAENAFHALKIVFANEIGNFCKAAGIDGLEVMEIFRSDRRLNLSPAYLQPGFAFGGSCLPKDLSALLHQARRHDLPMRLLESILRSNEEQLQRGIDLVQRTGRRRVGILGLAFKHGTDDLRESPMVRLAEALIGKGYAVSICDPHVFLARLVGSNRVFIERQIPHLARLLHGTPEEVVRRSDVLVLGKKDPAFLVAAESAGERQVVIDLVRLVERPERIRARYEGICW